MRYIPHTPEDIDHLLRTIGVPSVDALFEQVPEALRLARPLDLPPALAEADLRRHLEGLAGRNRGPRRALSFLGGGVYDHYAPAAIDEILRRSEFYTAYTPYQAEVSQGTLQAIFEFQTMVCQLLGLDVANASLYDGSTALAEALLMAQRITKRDRVLVSASVHPEYRGVVDGYFGAHPEDVETIPFGPDGRVDLGTLNERLDDTVAAVAVQHPNFFGCLTPIDEVVALARSRGALVVVTFSEALAFGLVKPPGAFGADIVAGEGQSLGIAPSFGGPHLGLFAARSEHVRAMPGRLVGQTVDARGRDAFVLTLSTREQHIRRERATSNICTNQGLCALAATVFLSLLGPRGLAKLARLNHVNAQRARAAIEALAGFTARFPDAPVFNEFVVRTPRPAAEIVAALAAEGLVPGLDLGRFYPELGDSLLVTVTEQHGPADIERLAAALRRFED
jgi:glycine dehydrogenase subunit 1